MTRKIFIHINPISGIIKYGDYSMAFEQYLKKVNVDENIIKEIMNVDYPKDKNNPKQNEANFMASVMKKCEELLDYDTISKVMYDRACCKTGARLKKFEKFCQGI